MGPPLTPVQAGAPQRAPAPFQLGEVDAQIGTAGTVVIIETAR